MCNCKYCNSKDIIKKGIKYKKQSYYCKNCKKYFREGDNRIKRDIKQKELALLMYSHNSSLRSIQSVIEKMYDTKISFSVVCNWIKSIGNLLQVDIEKIKEKEKSQTIEIIEMDELYSKYYDLKKNKQKESKYGLLLIDDQIKLLHLK